MNSFRIHCEFVNILFVSRTNDIVRMRHPEKIYYVFEDKTEIA